MGRQGRGAWPVCGGEDDDDTAADPHRNPEHRQGNWTSGRGNPWGRTSCTTRTRYVASSRRPGSPKRQRPRGRPRHGSLTLALLDRGAAVTAIEIDPLLAARLPKTIAEHSFAQRDPPAYGCQPRCSDPAPVGPAQQPTAVVANLPYNIAVPALIHLFSEFPTIRTAMVMVQAEVAERLAAEPGGKDYGVPSVKIRFFGNVRRYGMVSPTVFWPIPGSTPVWCASTVMRPRRGQDEAFRRQVFELVDIAFAQPQNRAQRVPGLGRFGQRVRLEVAVGEHRPGPPGRDADRRRLRATAPAFGHRGHRDPAVRGRALTHRVHQPVTSCRTHNQRQYRCGMGGDRFGDRSGSRQGQSLSRSRRPPDDGYHELTTVFHAVSLADEITRAHRRPAVAAGGRRGCRRGSCRRGATWPGRPRS